MFIEAWRAIETGYHIQTTAMVAVDWCGVARTVLVAVRCGDLQ